MQKIEKGTLSPENAEIGESHNLHNNAEVHTASALVKSCSCSVQRRFSPRLHATILSRKSIFSPKFRRSPQRYPLVSSAESAVEGIIHILTPSSPKIFTDSKKQIPYIPCRNPSFQRRLSPRLHRFPDVCENSAISVVSTRNAEVTPGSVSQVHQIPQDEFKKCVLQRRVSPRLDGDGENVKQIPILNAHRASEKSPYCGLHAKSGSSSAKRSKYNYPKDAGSENKHSYGVVLAANDELLCEIAIRSKVSEKKPWIDGVAPVITGEMIDIPFRYPNFQRRFSPRLHQFPEEVCENSAIPVDSTMNAELSPSSVSQFHQISEDGFKMSVLQRRVSPRFDSDGELVKQTPISNARSDSEKNHYCGIHANNSFSNANRSKCDYPKDIGCESKHSNGTVRSAYDALSGEITIRSKVSEKKPWMDGVAPVIAGGRIDARVKNTLQIFRGYCSQFLQEEERCMKNEMEKEKKSRFVTSKVKEIKQIPTPPGLKAVYKMKEKNEILYPNKSIGHVPGIEVGFQFFSRFEMVAVGFHSHWLNGIDYIGSASKMEIPRYYNFPIAIGIVMSGQYEDDLDYSEDIFYTGVGAHDLVGSKLKYPDMVLIQGNMALKNSMEQSIPIRVIRGHRSANCSGKTYTYDGLYTIVESWHNKGLRGQHVFKCHLKRVEGQRKLTTNQVQFFRGCSCKTYLNFPGLVCCDISNGQEAIHIPVTNLFDDAIVDEGFTYIKTIEVAESVNLPTTTGGCDCKGNCTNCNTCSCVKLNGSDFPYVRRRDGGRLVEAKDVIFECGPNCSCGPRCLNRTSQRAIKYHLEVYRTPDKGWAVKSWDFIPSGAPVCEFVGLLRRSDEVDNMSGNDFIFEIDCWHTMNEIEGRERRFGNVAMSAINVLPNMNENTLDISPEFCIDAGSRGNVSRFMNHSCEPNLFVQCVLSAHRDLRLARLVFFAAENIPPMQELTYDYGYALNSVVGPDGKVKALPCFCGASGCRKRLY